jgi:hypothetical protein
VSNISPQRTQSSQRLFKIFLLGDLCALCGELLCFFHDQTGRFFRQRRRSYETTPKWHSVMMINLPVSMAWIKQRTAESSKGGQVSNDEGRVTKDGIASRNLF